MTTSRTQLKIDLNHGLGCSCVYKSTCGPAKITSPVNRIAISKPFPRASGLVAVARTLVEFCAHLIGWDERAIEERPNYFGTVWSDCNCRRPVSANERSAASNMSNIYGEPK